jgi:hypothetical protein
MIGKASTGNNIVDASSKPVQQQRAAEEEVNELRSSGQS